MSSDEGRVATLLSDLADQVTAPPSVHVAVDGVLARAHRRQVVRRSVTATGTAIVAFVVAVMSVGGWFGAPARYASAGTAAPRPGVIAVGTYHGDEWSISARYVKRCPDPSDESAITRAHMTQPASRPHPVGRVAITTTYNGRVIERWCDTYPWDIANSGNEPLINYGGGQADPHTHLGIFTGWAQPNVAMVRVHFGNGQKLKVLTVDLGHGIPLRLFGYAADNRLHVNHLDAYDTVGRQLGHISGK